MADYDSSAPVRTEVNGDVVAKIADGTTNTQLWSIDANGVGKVNLTDGTNTLGIDANGGIGVTPTTGSEVGITDGTDSLEINGDGSINVVVQDSVSGGEVHDYGSATAGVPNTPTDVTTYTVTTDKTLKLKGWKCAASGKAKFELLIGTTVTDVSFTDSVSGNFESTFPQPIEVAAGVVVKVQGTNRDKANMDMYAWINGEEV